MAKEGTYEDVCNEYVAFVHNHYGNPITCIFDGYDDPNSTKRAEQDRRVINRIQ